MVAWQALLVAALVAVAASDEAGSGTEGATDADVYVEETDGHFIIHVETDKDVFISRGAQSQQLGLFSLASDFEDLKTRFEALNTLVTDPASGLAKLQSTVGTLDAAINDASTGLAAKVSGLSNTIDTLSGTHVSDLLDRVSDLEDAINTPSSGLSALLTDVRSTVYDSSSGLQKQVATLDTAVNAPTSGLSARLTEVRNTVYDSDSGLQKRVGTLDTTVNDPSTGLSSKVWNLNNAINDATTGLVKKVGDVSTKVNALDTTVNDASTGLSKKVNDLDVVVNDGTSGLTKKVADLLAAVNNPTTGILKQITDLKSTDGSLSSDITTLSGKIDGADFSQLDDLSFIMGCVNQDKIPYSQGRCFAMSCQELRLNNVLVLEPAAIGTTSTFECPEGHFSTLNGGVHECAFGQWDPEIPSSAACTPYTPCGANQRIISYGTGTTDHQCGPCDPGTYHNQLSYDQKTCPATTKVAISSCTASSRYNSAYDCSNAFDGVWADGGGNAWATAGQGAGSWIRFKLSATSMINTFKYQQRSCNCEWYRQATATFYKSGANIGTRTFSFANSRTGTLLFDVIGPADEVYLYFDSHWTKTNNGFDEVEFRGGLPP